MLLSTQRFLSECDRDAFSGVDGKKKRLISASSVRAEQRLTSRRCIGDVAQCDSEPYHPAHLRAQEQYQWAAPERSVLVHMHAQNS